MTEAIIVAAISIVAWSVTAWVTVNILKTHMEESLRRVKDLEEWREKHTLEYNNFKYTYAKEVSPILEERSRRGGD